MRVIVALLLASTTFAPWALSDFGFRAIVAVSFADIFASNSAKTGLVAVALPPATVAEIARRADDREGYDLTVDLESCTVSDGDGIEAAFEMDAFRQRCLLGGLDEIGLTLEHEAAIAAYESSHQNRAR